jgi:hypothetical protein
MCLLSNWALNAYPALAFIHPKAIAVFDRFYSGVWCYVGGLLRFLVVLRRFGVVLLCFAWSTAYNHTNLASATQPVQTLQSIVGIKRKPNPKPPRACSRSFLRLRLELVENLKPHPKNDFLRP